MFGVNENDTAYDSVGIITEWAVAILLRQACRLVHLCQTGSYHTCRLALRDSIHNMKP